ncbi:MAG: MFS transporter [Ignavibacteriales bacterium]
MRKAFLLTALAVTVVAMTPNSVIIPTLPAIAAGLGVSRAQVNMLVTVYTASSAVSALFVGMTADRLGRKRVVIPALIMYAVGGMTPVFLPRFGLALAGRVVQGVGGAGMMSSIYGLIGDIYRDLDDRNRALGVVNGTIAISEMGVPLVGGALAAITWKAPFFAYGLAAPAAALCAVTLPVIVNSRDPSTGYARGLAATVSSRVILGTFLAKFGFSLAYFVLLTAAPFVVVSRLRGTSVLAGTLMIPMGVCWSVSAFSMPRLTARYTTRHLAVAGAFAQAMAALGMGFSWSTPAMGAMFALWGIGAGLSNPALLSMMIESSGESYRGAVSSLYGCVTLIGGSLGPVASAVLVTPSGDLAPAFVFASGVMFASSLGFARLTSRAAPPAAREEEA